MPAPARRFALLAGTAYTALGVLGTAVTGFSGFTASRGVTLLGLELNGLQNLLHVAAGMLLVVGAARSERTARTSAMLTGAVFAVIGLLGIAITGRSGNILALNDHDNALHLLTAAIATVAAVRSAITDHTTGRDPTSTDHRIRSLR